MNVPFSFDEEYILENDAVLLRPLNESDRMHLQHFVEEPELWRYSLMRINSLSGFHNYIHQALQARKDHKEYPFIVFDKRTQRYAGSTRFYDIQLANKSLQLGYTWYGKSFQGTHVNKHCKFLLFEFAFETMGMERIELRADARNERSKQAMLSIGCTLEGCLRNHLPTGDGSRRDSIILSVLQQEWGQAIKASLREKLLAL